MQPTVVFVRWMAVVFIERTDGVVVVEHIVQLYLWRPCAPLVCHVLIAMTQIEVGTHVIGELVLLIRPETVV